MPGSVLFVCTANICRSPMAAVLFRQYLKKTQVDWMDWRIDLAGTWASDGEQASNNSCVVMARRGLDISRHRSKTVTYELLELFDLILTMEPGHKEALQVEFPTVASRVFLLSEMQGLAAPIWDPFGEPVESYEVTAQTMEKLLAKGMPRILSLVAARQE